jgi:thymidylate synthase (FAD)
LKVTLLTHTPEPEKIVAAAAKLCYSNAPVSKLMDDLDEEKTTSFLNKLSGLGHASPVEHCSFTFAIEGVSRSFLAQITRHRIASYSVRSQRYCRMTGDDIVCPPAVAEDYEANEAFSQAIQSIKFTYNHLHNILEDKHTEMLMLNDASLTEPEARKKASKMANEDARFILPEACETSMIVTMNARELNNFFKLRCCNRAQWEIRSVADEMLKLVYPIAPTLFKSAGPGCVSCGHCTEGAMTCGHSDYVKEKYSMLKATAGLPDFT